MIEAKSSDHALDFRQICAHISVTHVSQLMSHHKSSHRGHKQVAEPQKKSPAKTFVVVIIGVVVVALILYRVVWQGQNRTHSTSASTLATMPVESRDSYQPTEKWLQRAYAIDQLYHYVYTPAGKERSARLVMRIFSPRPTIHLC